MTANTHRYSECQVLCGLRLAWSEIFGSAALFDSSTRLDEYMRADGTWEETDFAEVFRDLERFFGFRCAAGEWGVFLRGEEADTDPRDWKTAVAPRLTFGALGRFIADRADGISMRPVVLAGRECRSAGVFLGLLQLAGRVAGRDVRFRPSTRIVEVLRGGALDDFWTRLRWISQNRIPQLPSFWGAFANFALGLSFLGGLFGVLAAWATGGLGIGVVAFVVALAAFLAASIYKHWANPLPAGVESFRDLANLIADADFDAAL